MTDTNGFIKGALIGGALAGIAGLLLAPKPGAQLLQDIADTCDSAQKNGHDFIEAVKEKGACLAHYFDEEPEHDYSAFLIGGALGAVIAGVAALLLAPGSGKKLRKLLGNQYEEIVERAEDFASTIGVKGKRAMHELHHWHDTLADLITKLTCTSVKGKNPNHSFKVDDILDLAHLGVRLYHQLQGRR